MKYAARFSFQYGGKNLDAGQVVELRGLPNDARLVSLGYFEEVPKKATLYQCGICGEEFTTDSFRLSHGDMQHPETYADREDAAERIKRARRHPDLADYVREPRPVA